MTAPLDCLVMPGTPRPALKADAGEFVDVAEAAPLVTAESRNRLQQVNSRTPVAQRRLGHDGVDNSAKYHRVATERDQAVEFALERHRRRRDAGRRHPQAGFAFQADRVEFA